jgi:hypothetical protein
LDNRLLFYDGDVVKIRYYKIKGGFIACASFITYGFCIFGETKEKAKNKLLSKISLSSIKET